MIEALFEAFMETVHIASVITMIEALVEASSMCEKSSGRAFFLSQEQFFAPNRLRFPSSLQLSACGGLHVHFHRYLTPLHVIGHYNSRRNDRQAWFEPLKLIRSGTGLVTQMHVPVAQRPFIDEAP
jgi:hypothetical protein